MTGIFSTSGQVFLAVAARPDSRVREIAIELGVTERTVVHALNHLMATGLLTVTRRGRSNEYQVNDAMSIDVGRLSVDVRAVVGLVMNDAGGRERSGQP